MPLGVFTFGHGGGVPYGNAGNTNFALIPNLSERDAQRAAKNAYGLLERYPFWLIDIGPETMLRICGCLGEPSVVHNIKGIILTHCHADHSGGLPSLAWRLRFGEQSKPWLVFPEALRPMLEQQTVEIRHHQQPQLASLDDYFEVCAPGVCASAPFTIDPFTVVHGIFDFPAYGLHVTPYDNPSVRLTFSGDTADPLPLDLFRHADAIFHDCQFYDDGSAGTHVHCPYPALKERVPAQLRNRVHLCHTSRTPPDEVFADGFGWVGKNDLRWF